MNLCGRQECVYQSVQDMVNKMKEDIAKKQSISYPEQIVVAKIYDVTAAILSEACRANFAIDRNSCEPSKQFRSEFLTIDTFILLNQMKEDGIIKEEYAQILFETLKKLKPDIARLVDEDRTKGLV